MKKFASRFTALICTAVCALQLASCSKKDGNTEVRKYKGIKFETNLDELEMGEYTVSDIGTKLYYSPDEFPPELISALEKYFISFSQSDYDSYLESVYPDYVTEMNKYLKKDYGYELDQSFAGQCENLKNNAGGEFKVTRIKAELPEEDGSEEHLDILGEIFGTDFYESVKKDCDKIYDMQFYVMAEVDGKESMLISEYEIVFAEKDGKFYTFG